MQLHEDIEKIFGQNEDHSVATSFLAGNVGN